LSVGTIQPRSERAVTSAPRAIGVALSGTDRAYRLLSTGAGLLTLGILLLIGLFLALQSLPAFRLMGGAFFTTTVWQPDGISHRFGIAAVLYWTVVIAVIALCIALIVSLPTALFITEYAPRRLKRLLIALVDLLAAVPSVIYGV